MVAVGRSLPGTFSFLLVGALLLYVYAMVDWVFFADHDPEHFDSLGRAVLTLFLLMPLDGLGDAVHAGLEISRWSIVSYASYVLLASFVLVNVLIGVVISSLDEAREMEREQDEHTGTQHAPEQELRERIAAARRAPDELEEGLVGLPTSRRPPVVGDGMEHLRQGGDVVPVEAERPLRGRRRWRMWPSYLRRVPLLTFLPAATGIHLCRPRRLPSHSPRPRLTSRHLSYDLRSRPHWPGLDEQILQAVVDDCTRPVGRRMMTADLSILHP